MLVFTPPMINSEQNRVSIDLQRSFSDMGVVIKADEVRRGTEGKVISTHNQLLRSVLVHVVSAAICAVVCSYSYWFPWLYCFASYLVRIYLPSVLPVVFGPKCMFVVANAIVAVVVGEWRQTCAESKSLHEDMYEEYLRRSRGTRRVLVYKKSKRKKISAAKEKAALEFKKEAIIVEEKKEDIAEVINMNTLSKQIKEDIVETDVVNKTENLVEDAPANNFEEMNYANKLEETLKELMDDAQSCADSDAPDQKHFENGEKDVEETRGDEELNKRVEDFIERVRRRRWHEADNWLICSA